MDEKYLAILREEGYSLEPIDTRPAHQRTTQSINIGPGNNGPFVTFLAHCIDEEGAREDVITLLYQNDNDKGPSPVHIRQTMALERLLIEREIPYRSSVDKNKMIDGLRDKSEELTTYASELNQVANELEQGQNPSNQTQ